MKREEMLYLCDGKHDLSEPAVFKLLFQSMQILSKFMPKSPASSELLGDIARWLSDSHTTVEPVQKNAPNVYLLRAHSSKRPKSAYHVHYFYYSNHGILQFFVSNPVDFSVGRSILVLGKYVLMAPLCELVRGMADELKGGAGSEQFQAAYKKVYYDYLRAHPDVPHMKL